MITIHIIIINFESLRMTKSVPMEGGVGLHMVHMVLTSTKWPEWSQPICGSFPGGPGGLTTVQKPHPHSTHLASACSWGDQVMEALCKYVPGSSPSEFFQWPLIQHIYYVHNMLGMGLGTEK